MTISKSLTFIPNNNGDTTAIVSMHNAIIAAGMVQTSDTGQLDVSGSGPVYSSTNANNYGYTVYKFNDAAQATFPIFFRIDWKNEQTSSPKIFELFITIGTATNGAGTIGGLLSGAARTCAMNGSGGTAAATTAYASLLTCGDGSFIGFMVAAENPTSNGSNLVAGPQMFYIERFRDSSGAPLATGFWSTIGAGSGATDFYSSTLNHVTIVGSATTGVPVADLCPWGTTTSAGSGSSVPVFPIAFTENGTIYSLGMMCAHAADWRQGQIINVSHLGGNRQYIGAGVQAAGAVGFFKALGQWATRTVQFGFCYADS